MLVWLFIPPPEDDVRAGATSHSKSRVQRSPDDVTSCLQRSEEKSEVLGTVAAFRRIYRANMWDVFLIRFFMGFAVIVYRSNFALMLEARFDTSATTIGYITSFTAVIGTFSGMLVGNISSYYKNDTHLLVHVSVLQFFAILCLSVAPSLLVLVCCLGLLSLANSLAKVALTNITLERSHHQETGSLLGLSASVLSVARMLSPLIAGVAQEFHVSGAAFVGAASAACGVTVLLMGISSKTLPKEKKNV